MKTKIIVDSTCDFPEHMQHLKEQVEILPINIYVDDEEFQDGENIHIEDIFQAIEEKKVIKTSQISLYRMKALFENHAKAGQDFIFLAFTSCHSGIYETACMVISELRTRYPGVQMEAIDTKGATAINGLLAKKLLEMDYEGISYTEMIAYAKDYATRGKYIFVVKELDHLVRGGRICKFASIAGGILNIKPIIQLKDGEMYIYKKMRGYKKAIKEILAIAKASIGDHYHKTVLVGYSADKKEAHQLRDQLLELGCQDVMLFQIGSGLATHLGRNGIGILLMD